MLVVRKEGNAHAAYNSFRSAFELLEAVGHEPHDSFEETLEDVAPLQRLQQQQERMQQQMQQQEERMQQQIQQQQHQIDDLVDEVKTLKEENQALRGMINV